MPEHEEADPAPNDDSRKHLEVFFLGPRSAPQRAPQRDPKKEPEMKPQRADTGIALEIVFIMEICNAESSGLTTYPGHIFSSPPERLVIELKVQLS